MRWRGCPHEPAVARAVREGRWPPGLAAHLDGCDACREAARVAAWLQAVAAEAAAVPPDPGRIWSRAAIAGEILRRQELARRAARPALWFQRAAAIVAAAATAVWVATAGADLWREVVLPLTREPWSLDAVWPTTLDGIWPLAAAAGSLLVLAFLAARAAIDRLDRP